APGNLTIAEAGVDEKPSSTQGPAAEEEDVEIVHLDLPPWGLRDEIWAGSVRLSSVRPTEEDKAGKQVTLCLPAVPLYIPEPQDPGTDLGAVIRAAGEAAASRASSPAPGEYPGHASANLCCSLSRRRFPPDRCGDGRRRKLNNEYSTSPGTIHFVASLPSPVRAAGFSEPALETENLCKICRPHDHRRRFRLVSQTLTQQASDAFMDVCSL
ncbi:unnamed protein product, partial [Symbiodinium necroappetens]